MTYGLELLFASWPDGEAWTGGLLHLQPAGGFRTIADVLDHVEAWSRLCSTGALPWPTDGRVSVVGVVHDDAVHGRPLVTYAPDLVRDGFFEHAAPPPSRSEVERFLEAVASDPDLPVPSDLWVEMDGIANKVHDYAGWPLVHYRARATRDGT